MISRRLVLLYHPNRGRDERQKKEGVGRLGDEGGGGELAVKRGDLRTVRRTGAHAESGRERRERRREGERSQTRAKKGGGELRNGKPLLLWG